MAHFGRGKTHAPIIRHGRVPPVVYTDAGSGTILLSGAIVESYLPPIIHTNTCTGSIALSGSSVDYPSYSAVILATPGLVSYWRCGEASGNLLDSKGSNPATTVAGGITRQASGLLTSDANGAILGNGVTGTYASVPANASLDTAAVCVECWVRPTSLPGVTASIVDKWASTTDWYLEYNSVGRWRFYMRPSSGADIQLDTASAPAPLRPQAGVRHHIIGTYSAADGMRLYINGIQVATAAATGFGGRTTSGAIRFLAASVSAASFPGTLDEIAIYNAVLPPATVLAHYNAGAPPLPVVYTDTCSGTIILSGAKTESYFPPVVYTDTRSGTIALSGSAVDAFFVGYPALIVATPGLVSYWRAGEASGALLDSKDSNPSTIVAGGITRNVAGLLTGDADGAVQGDGVAGSWISVPFNANMQTGAQLTVEAWILPIALPATSCYLVYRFLPFYLEVSSNRHLSWYVRDVNGNDTLIDAVNAATVGQRHHIVGVYDAAGTFKLYVNGVSVGTPNRTPNANIITASATGSFRMFSDAVGSPSFNGVIDEVAFYNTALTAQQVLAHYDAGAPSAVYTDAPSGRIIVSGSAIVERLDYTDVRAGSITLTGSVTESWTRAPVYTDAPIGSLSLTGTRTESRSHASTATGTIVVTGTRTEAWARNNTDVATGSLLLSGTRTESRINTDVCSGSIALTGTRTENRSCSDARIGTILLTGSLTLSRSYQNAPTGILGLAGANSESSVGSTSRTGSIALTGSVVESYALAGASAPIGVLTLTGSVVESYVTVKTDAPSGRIALSGSSVVSCQYTDSRTGTLLLSGTCLDAYLKAGADTPTGRITLNGTCLEAHVATATPTGRIVFTGTSTDQHLRAGADAPTGTLTLSGTRTEQRVYTDQPAGLLVLNGTATVSRTYPDAVVGTVRLIGVMTNESWGIAGFVFYDDFPKGTIPLRGRLITQGFVQNGGARAHALTGSLRRHQQGRISIGLTGELTRPTTGTMR